MNFRFTLSMLLSAILIMGGALMARDMESFQKNIPGNSEIKKVNLECDIGVAHFNLSTHQGGDLLSSTADYDADKIEVDVEYEQQGSAADIYIFSEKVSKRLNLDTDDCEWEISLSHNYVWDIDLDIGFTDSDIDLSGLPIERFQMDVGASECNLAFNRPNPHRMRKLDIDAGAGDLEISGLGYANCDHVSFDGGAGNFVLNFDGMEKGFHTAKIDVGVGEVRVEIPKDFPVRIETNDSWLSSVKIRGTELEKVDNGVFETEDFDDSDFGLEIELDVGIGQATIGWADGSGIILTIRSTLGNRYIYGHRYSDDRYLLSALQSLPNLPELPALPELSALYELPELPELPELSDLPALPALAPLPALPAIPAMPALVPLHHARKVLE